MRALLDVNVLIALLDPDHVQHSRCREWLRARARAGWASCPITQNGCIRIMSQPAYPHGFPVSAVVERLAHATSRSRHEFWPDDVSLLNGKLVDGHRVHGPRQVTDVYLLALAVRHRGTFATLDGRISIDAVTDAQRANLEVI